MSDDQPLLYEVIDGQIVELPPMGSLQEFTASRLSRHEYPRRVAFVDALPKTPAGKVNRKVLRDAEQAAQPEG